jgi:hypothetical protein
MKLMKRLIAISGLIFFSGCASAHSPYDLYDWCRHMGSSRLASVGPNAFDPVRCEQELKEDLADPTPRILFIPRDVAMAPVITARIVWGFLGRTQPPF